MSHCIGQVNEKLYPDVSTIAKVLVVIPVTTVTGRRMKSALKYLNDHDLEDSLRLFGPAYSIFLL